MCNSFFFAVDVQWIWYYCNYKWFYLKIVISLQPVVVNISKCSLESLDFNVFNVSFNQ